MHCQSPLCRDFTSADGYVVTIETAASTADRGGLQEVESGAVCGDVVIAQRCAAGQHRFEVAGALELEPLRLVRADDAEPDGGRQHAARGAGRGTAAASSRAHAERSQRGAERPARGGRSGSRAALRVHAWARRARSRAHVAGKRAALHAAGAVGDDVGQERVAARVELRQARRIVVRRGGQRQLPRPACQSASRDERRERVEPRHLARCHAASSPPECAKPPVGNAESASCHRMSGVYERQSAIPRRGPGVMRDPSASAAHRDVTQNNAVPLRERQDARRL